MTSIHLNLGALGAQNGMKDSMSEMTDAMNRLSTGLRINSASDDAAGSAIASKMEAQTRSLGVAIRNANDAISLTQTAEGALGEVENMLQRMRELSVQAGNSTLNASDRAQIQAEIDALSAEVDKIAESTNFNKVALFDGVRTSVDMQIGIDASDTMSIALQKTDVAALGIGSSATTRAITSERVTAFSDTDADQIKINGQDFASGDLTAATIPLNGIDVDTSSLATPNAAQSAGYTAAALAAAINTNTHVHGAKATAFNKVVATTSSYTAAAATLNGVTIASRATQQEFVDAINNEVSDLVATLENGVITLSNTTGADINVGGNMTGMGFATDIYGGFISIANVDGSDVKIEAGSTVNGYGSAADGTVAIVNRLGFNEIDGTTIKSAVVTTDPLTAAMNVKVNGVAIGGSFSGASAADSAASKAAAINAVSDQTNVVATAKTVIRLGVDLVNATLGNTTDAEIGGIVTSFAAVTDVDELASTINTAVGSSTDIVATIESDTGLLRLESASGQNITVDAGTDTALFDRALNEDGSAVTGFASAAGTGFGFLTLTSTDGSAISLEDGETDAHTGLATLGLQAASEKAETTTTGLSVSTVAEANAALTAIDSAINTISTFRAGFGATENRLDSAISNLTTYQTNLEAAKGRITDADFAAETSNLTKAQILQQAATSMLAQANASKQGLLALLQG